MYRYERPEMFKRVDQSRGFTTFDWFEWCMKRSSSHTRNQTVLLHELLVLHLHTDNFLGDFLFPLVFHQRLLEGHLWYFIRRQHRLLSLLRSSLFARCELKARCWSNMCHWKTSMKESYSRPRRQHVLSNATQSSVWVIFSQMDKSTRTVFSWSSKPMGKFRLSLNMQKTYSSWILLTLSTWLCCWPLRKSTFVNCFHVFVLFNCFVMLS